MARILLASMPFSSHIEPALPLARTLVERGHDVRWYTGRRFQATVEATGARYLPVEHAPDFDERKLEEVYPQLKGLKPLARYATLMADVFLAAGPAQADDLEQILRDWPADVLLSEPAFAGAAIISHKCRIPWAALNLLPMPLDGSDTAPFGLGLPPASGPLGRVRNKALHWLADKVLFRDALEAANTLRASAGMPPADSVMRLGLSSYLYLQGTARAFEYPRTDLPAQVHFIGPVLPPQPATPTLPVWWHELETDRPVVLLTPGSEAGDDFDNLAAATVRALARKDVLLVIDTGGRPTSSLNLDRLPGNVRVETGIPHDKLMPYVSVVVTNGGYGAVQAALAGGVPVIVAWRTAEKAETGARVTWAGVGIDLKKDRPSVKQIGVAVREVLEDSTYWLKAQAVAADFARHDAPTEAAALIEKLAETRQPVLRATSAPTQTRIRQRRTLEVAATLSHLAAAGKLSE
ncbi:MAG TPA: glycosyltransferase [Chloroflexia bacterium]